MSRVVEGYCSECYAPCFGHTVDFGIGPYEFWGQRGNDTNKQWVSQCCDATIVDEMEMPIDSPEEATHEPGETNED